MLLFRIFVILFDVISTAVPNSGAKKLPCGKLLAYIHEKLHRDRARGFPSCHFQNDAVDCMALDNRPREQ